MKSNNLIYKATAIAPANIAFIKFWGKKDSQLNIPFNDSISMNLNRCQTKTYVKFNSELKDDVVIVNKKRIEGTEKNRVVAILDKVRKMSGLRMFAEVVSENDFPSNAGIASSASAFSALALAASVASGLGLSKKDLSILARLGSGSACRSIYDGFSYWKKGRDSKSSFAVQFAKPDFWDVADIVAVVDTGRKKTSSTEGHNQALTSPYFKTRLNELKIRTPLLKKALLDRNFQKFGELVEEEAVSLHVCAMTSKPPIFYWNRGTMEVIETVFGLRSEGILAYFTIDAGPNVHVICRNKNIKRVEKNLKKLKSVLFTITNKPGLGARLEKNDNN